MNVIWSENCRYAAFHVGQECDVPRRYPGALGTYLYDTEADTTRRLSGGGETRLTFFGDEALVMFDPGCFGIGFSTLMVFLDPGIDHAPCSAGVVVPEPGANPGLVEDCTNLMEAMGRLARLRSLGWDSGTPIGEWKGIVVSGSPPRVRELHLASLGLEGFIPPSLGKLAMLEILDLFGNRLGGEIPAELSGLRKLEELYLGSNSLLSVIPSELGDIASLRILDLASNHLRGSIPTELGKLGNLSALHLNGNSLTGDIPAALSRMTSLRILHLRGNELSGCVPLELPDLWVDASELERCGT